MTNIKTNIELVGGVAVGYDNKDRLVILDFDTNTFRCGEETGPIHAGISYKKPAYNTDYFTLCGVVYELSLDDVPGSYDIVKAVIELVGACTDSTFYRGFNCMDYGTSFKHSDYMVSRIRDAYSKLETLVDSYEKVNLVASLLEKVGSYAPGYFASATCYFSFGALDSVDDSALRKYNKSLKNFLKHRKLASNVLTRRLLQPIPATRDNIFSAGGLDVVYVLLMHMFDIYNNKTYDMVRDITSETLHFRDINYVA